jgi:Zn-dependent protease with chaperone function
MLGTFGLALLPVVGLLFPLAISRQRELLADADAALLTRIPPPWLGHWRRLPEREKDL